MCVSSCWQLAKKMVKVIRHRHKKALLPKAEAKESRAGVAVPRGLLFILHCATGKGNSSLTINVLYVSFCVLVIQVVGFVVANYTTSQLHRQISFDFFQNGCQVSSVSGVIFNFKKRILTHYKIIFINIIIIVTTLTPSKIDFDTLTPDTHDTHCLES